MDQCKHCAARGNIKKCEASKCNIHESWYVQTLKLFPRYASQQSVEADAQNPRQKIEKAKRGE